MVGKIKKCMMQADRLPMKLSLKVVPGASSSCIVGWLGESLKIRVKERAESGKANNAVRELLAKTLDVPKATVVIVSGKTSARKVVEISSLPEDEILRKLNELDF